MIVELMVLVFPWYVFSLFMILVLGLIIGILSTVYSVIKGEGIN